MRHVAKRTTTADLVKTLGINRVSVTRQINLWYFGEIPTCHHEDVWIERGQRIFVSMTPQAARDFLKWYKAKVAANRRKKHV